MGYFEACKAKSIKLQLGYTQGRYWRSKRGGKAAYYAFPNTAEGYSQALAQWATSQGPPDPDGARRQLEAMVGWYEQQGDESGYGEALRAFLAASADMEVPNRRTSPYVS
jgi:hypothetical protein